MLKKYKLNGEIELAPVYFISVTKTVTNDRFRIENSFQEILYMIMFGLIMDLVGMLNQLINMH